MAEAAVSVLPHTLAKWAQDGMNRSIKTAGSRLGTVCGVTGRRYKNR
jgi:hypothetical protein